MSDPRQGLVTEEEMTYRCSQCGGVLHLLQDMIHIRQKNLWKKIEAENGFPLKLISRETSVWCDACVRKERNDATVGRGGTDQCVQPEVSELPE